MDTSNLTGWAVIALALVTALKEVAPHFFKRQESADSARTAANQSNARNEIEIIRVTNEMTKNLIDPLARSVERIADNQGDMFRLLRELSVAIATQSEVLSFVVQRNATDEEVEKIQATRLRMKDTINEIQSGHAAKN